MRMALFCYCQRTLATTKIRGLLNISKPLIINGNELVVMEKAR